MKFTLIFGFFCLCFIGSFLGRFSYTADMLSCFYLQYLIGAVVFAIYYKWRKLKKYFLVALIIGLISAGKIFVTYLPETEKRKAMNASEIKIVQFNVLHANRELDKAAEWILKSNADILVFQEVKPRIVTGFAKLKEKYPNYIASPREDAFGAMVMSRLKILNAERKEVLGGVVHYTEVSFELANGEILKLYELHTLPPVGTEHFEERNSELAYIAKIIAADRAPNKVLVGDFNITPYSTYFSQLKSESGLKNSMQSFATLHGTWPSDFPAIFRIPIDHLLVTENIGILDKLIGPDLGSDHLPIVTNLVIYK
jgi:endonuclease/exonuclease/phosphatase (EEP) superfamily protein YafD